MPQNKRSIREWWQVPRRASQREESRQVSFLELFYDLVYVVLIAELSHSLSAHASWQGVGNFVFLFIIVWWAWFNGTSYHDIHGKNDVRTRVFTFLQMFTVVAMAVFAHDALGESSIGFALSYATFQLILTFLWWRTGVHDPGHRVLSQPYSFTFLVTTLVFALSIFVAPPIRFSLWGLAVLTSLLLPILMFTLGRLNSAARSEWNRITFVTPSLVERFGLFAIIVLGEVIVGVVSGLSGLEELNAFVGIVAFLGTLMAVALWWLYFDFVSHRKPRDDRLTIFAWFYLHLPMTMGIAAVGAGALNVVEHGGASFPDEVRWLLVSASSLILLSVALMIQTIELAKEFQGSHPAGRRMMFVSAGLVLLLGLAANSVIPFMGLLVLLILAPVIVAFRAWLILPS